MASGIYSKFFANLMNKEIDLEADTIKVALLDSNHAFNVAHESWAEVSANEISGAGYTADGATLAGKAVTQAATTKWDATNVSWSEATFSAYHAVLYAVAGLIASIDFGGEQAIADGTFAIEWDAAGIITLSE